MASVKMICPKCGGEMNHHADKLIYAADEPHTGQLDRWLGGRIEETHSCPSCGAVAARVAE